MPFKCKPNVVLARRFPLHQGTVLAMASLGFRPPQFSEDVAWLPTWLHQHQVESFNEHIKEPQTPSDQEFKDLAFLQGIISEGKDANLLPREEGRYNNCHLFLSGEDTPVTFAPSSGNVLHFHLHLSLDGNSQNIPSPLVDTERPESDNALMMQRVETSAGPGEKANLSKMDYSAVGANLFPQTSNPKTLENVGPRSRTNNKDSRGKYEEKFNIKYLKVADINDAVELSIAASEALAIHEILKSGSSSEALPAGAILEVALQVKQARLVGLEDAFHFSTEEIDEIDFLSDLDESTLADAFEDVGLSVTGPGPGLDDLHVCDSAVSHVKDTPFSEYHCECDEKDKNVELKAEEDFDSISTQKQLKDVLAIDIHLTEDLPIESFDGKRQKRICDDPGLKTSSVACHIDSGLHWSVQANSDVLATAQRVEYATVDITPFQHQANVNSSPQAWNSENAEGEDKLINVVPDRFRSRWFGGWTGKEVDSSALMKRNNIRSIPEFFVGETSFLSESADVAPDENSFVKKLETSSKIPSQSSIPFEGLCGTANEGILLSQDVVRSSSLSLIDPLCSVVPCSISSENAGSTLAQNQNGREIDAEKCCSLTSEHGKESLQGTSVPNAEFVHGEGQVVPMIEGEISGPTVRRHLTSLKTYSVLLPSNDAVLERGSIYYDRLFPAECNLGLLPSEKNKCCIISEFTAVRDYEENHETSVVGNPVTELPNQSRNYDETAKDGSELQVHPQNARSLPLILNHRTRRFQASKLFLNDFNGEKDLEQAAVPDTIVDIQQSKNLQQLQSECKNLLTPVPVRKRVHFSEADVQLQQNKNLQKLQSAYKNCSITRAGKRLKYFKPRSDSRTQEVKRRLTNCLVKDGKRLIFQRIEFLLTGFSSRKEKEIEGLIWKYGGMVLSDIPSPPPNSRGKRSSRSNCQQLPVVLCLKKLRTTKFLYGCAVNAFMLKVNWLTDSIAAGSVLPPEKYMILSNQDDEKCTRIGKPVRRASHKYIFERVGFMLHGKHSFCTKLAKVFKHGGGQVFKTLQWLVQSLDSEKISIGAIVAEDKSRVSRHLKHCASERKIPMMSASWIINSLHSGKLLPFVENNHSSPLSTVKVPEFPISMELSEEI